MRGLYVIRESNRAKVFGAMEAKMITNRSFFFSDFQHELRKPGNRILVFFHLFKPE